MRRKRFDLTFEEAMYFLRKGKAIRRKSWHHQSRLVKFENGVRIILPPHVPGALVTTKNGEVLPALQAWYPYSHDFFARDWRVV